MPTSYNPFSGRSFVSPDDEAGKVEDDGTPVAPAGTATEIKRWVGDSHELAVIAIAAESARETPRKTLIDHLKEI